MQQIILFLSFVCTCYSEATPPLLSPAQIKYLEDVQVHAEASSLSAEKELLRRFKDVRFRFGLMLNGGYNAWALAQAPADELLTKVKKALSSLEYVTNFGVDPDFRKTHPGEPEMDFATIDKFGYIPNMWELRAMKSPLVNGTSLRQWEIMESAERALYKFPISSQALPAGPDATQARERPQYIGGNLRRIDSGLPRYGPYSAVIRNDVIRKRAVLLPGDSGGWENGCNASLTPVHKWWWYSRYDCDAMSKDTVLGTLESQAHTILKNAEYFGKVGGAYSQRMLLGNDASYLSRLVYQLLVPSAKATPFEMLLYTEAGLLGDTRPEDMKMIVANFPAVYGTDQATIVQEFCAKHRIPLAWALNDGFTGTEPSGDPATLGPDTRSTLDVAADRMLDPTSLLATNVSIVQDGFGKDVWKHVHFQMAASRSSGKKLQSSDFLAWWKKLNAFGLPLQPLQHGDCANVDQCVGTFSTGNGVKECVCKSDGEGSSSVASIPAKSPMSTHLSGEPVVLV